jgi:hypothetical protein
VAILGDVELDVIFSSDLEIATIIIRARYTTAEIARYHKAQ